jgi:hypothetical protein
VLLGRRAALTDALGRYAIDAGEGGGDLVVIAQGFEKATRPVSPPGDYDFTLESGPAEASQPQAGGARRGRRAGGGDTQ